MEMLVTAAVSAAVVLVVVRDAVTSVVEAAVVVVRCVVVVRFLVVDRFRLIVVGCWGTFEQMNDN